MSLFVNKFIFIICIYNFISLLINYYRYDQIPCWVWSNSNNLLNLLVDKFVACGVTGALCTLICCVTCSPCCFTCFYRSKMRKQYMLHKKPCCDCLVHCCCMYCALCQEHRELRNRGFDMIAGTYTCLFQLTSLYRSIKILNI